MARGHRSDAKWKRSMAKNTSSRAKGSDCALEESISDQQREAGTGAQGFGSSKSSPFSSSSSDLVGSPGGESGSSSSSDLRASADLAGSRGESGSSDLWMSTNCVGSPGDQTGSSSSDHRATADHTGPREELGHTPGNEEAACVASANDTKESDKTMTSNPEEPCASVAESKETPICGHGPSFSESHVNLSDCRAKEDRFVSGDEGMSAPKVSNEQTKAMSENRTHGASCRSDAKISEDRKSNISHEELTDIMSSFHITDDPCDVLSECSLESNRDTSDIDSDGPVHTPTVCHRLDKPYARTTESSAGHTSSYTVSQEVDYELQALVQGDTNNSNDQQTIAANDSECVNQFFDFISDRSMYSPEADTVHYSDGQTYTSDIFSASRSTSEHNGDSVNSDDFANQFILALPDVKTNASPEPSTSDVHSHIPEASIGLLQSNLACIPTVVDEKMNESESEGKTKRKYTRKKKNLDAASTSKTSSSACSSTSLRASTDILVSRPATMTFTPMATSFTSTTATPTSSGGMAHRHPIESSVTNDDSFELNSDDLINIENNWFDINDYISQDQATASRNTGIASPRTFDMRMFDEDISSTILQRPSLDLPSTSTLQQTSPHYLPSTSTLQQQTSHIDFPCTSTLQQKSLLDLPSTSLLQQQISPLDLPCTSTLQQQRSPTDLLCTSPLQHTSPPYLPCTSTLQQQTSPPELLCPSALQKTSPLDIPSTSFSQQTPNIYRPCMPIQQQTLPTDMRCTPPATGQHRMSMYPIDAQPSVQQHSLLTQHQGSSALDIHGGNSLQPQLSTTSAQDWPRQGQQDTGYVNPSGPQFKMHTAGLLGAHSQSCFAFVWQPIPIVSILQQCAPHRLQTDVGRIAPRPIMPKPT